MPPPPHLRASFRGEFRPGINGTPYEFWSTSLAFRSGGSLSTASGQDLADDLRDDFADMVTAMPSAWASNTIFTEVRLDSIGADGKITRDAIWSQVPNGGRTTQRPATLPPSCAVACTLDTKVRGAGRFGRMFLPLLGNGVGPDGVLAEGDQTEILTAFRQFVANASDAPGVDGGFAAVVASGAGAGALNDVREVRVGRVVDTMRSRRRSLDEAYKSAIVNP